MVHGVYTYTVYATVATQNSHVTQAISLQSMIIMRRLYTRRSIHFYIYIYIQDIIYIYSS